MTTTNVRSVVIGLDLGTSGLKALAVAQDGSVLARASHGYSTSRPEPGSAEQDPAEWMAACDSVMAQLAASVDPTSWSAIGLSAMLPTLVMLDEAYDPIGPAITWEDGRAEAEADAIRAEFSDAVLYRLTGQRLDARYLLPMYLHAAASGASPTYIVGAKDHLFQRLTGRLATDPSTAAGYGCFSLRTSAWDPALAAAAAAATTATGTGTGVGPTLPEVLESSASAPLDAALAARWGCAAGIPVVLGGADSVLGAYGLGIRSPGDIAVISGTSTVVIGWSEVARFDPQSRYLVTPMAGAGYGLELDLMTTGSALAWLSALLGVGGPEELVTLAESAALDNAPIVLPYLGPGEQGALWDPTLTGLIQGVTLGTGRADLARGLVAGIVMEVA
ncbi:MAG: FGGY family carbohydrate kinase, partial [Pseudolysinimonas sp.]